MALHEFKLPDPGEGLVEAEIVTWRVAVGDTIKINDIVVEIETSKSLVELPSPYAGTVSALLAAEGDMVDVGRPIIAIDDGVAVAGAYQGEAPAEDGPAVQANGRVTTLVGYGPKTTEAGRRRRKAGAGAGASTSAEPAAAAAHQEMAEAFSEAPAGAPRAEAPAAAAAPQLAAPSTAPPAAAATPTSAGGPPLAKPPVRKLAQDLGVVLAQLTGSGPDGVITREDVQAAAEAARPAADDQPAHNQPQEPEQTDEASEPEVDLVLAGPVDGHTRIPIKGVRKATAAAMVNSAFTAPHVTEWVTCDVSETIALVDRLKERREFKGVRISPLLVVSKAICLALGRVPQLNSSWDEASQHIVLKSEVNLGIAAATPRGLVVPNIKSAESMTLLELATAINELVTKAREGKAQPADMSKGTFTITNVGTFGVDAGTPILNPGEAGILCVGQFARRPWVVGSGENERIEPRWVTTLALSFDHRLADGEQASIFLATVAQTLTDPGLALLF